MSKYFIKRDRVDVENDSDLSVKDKLPCGTYLVDFDNDRHCFFLEKRKDLEVPDKIYGDLPKLKTRIIDTYRNRNRNTGILLSGEKGGGKTLLVDMVSSTLLEDDVPTIIVSKTFEDTALAQFIRKIDDECVVVFDEFEKLYEKTNHGKNDQKGLLSLFDGVFPGKFLFMLTINESGGIDPNLQSRPGRLFYHLKFDGVNPSTIEDYCCANLKGIESIKAKRKKEIMTISQAMGVEFSFDVMKALVEESNRYDESPIETLKYLNVEPSTNGQFYRIESITKDGKEVKFDFEDDFRLTLMTEAKISYYAHIDEHNKPFWEYFYFGPKNLVERTDDTIKYEENGLVLILKRAKSKHWTSIL